MENDFIIQDACDGNPVVFNITFLKSHEFLAEERVFFYLTGIEQHPQMKKNENTSMSVKIKTYFRDFSITSFDWNLFLRFLVAPSQFRKRDQRIELTELLLRLGIFKEVTKEMTDKGRTYNPQSPMQDVNQQFIWRVFNINDHVDLKECWSVGERVYGHPQQFYFRKPK